MQKNNFGGKKDKDFQLTEKEVDRLKECLENPEFVKLFAEYAKEISDPNTMKETDLYIKQLESEGSKLPNAIMIPKASYCIQCKTRKEKKQFYLNICSSDKIQIYKEEEQIDKQGSQYSVPLVVGYLREQQQQQQKQQEKVKEEEGLKGNANNNIKASSLMGINNNNNYTVVDVVFNTETCKRAEKDPLFKHFISQLALDYVEEKFQLNFQKENYTEVLGKKSIGEPSSLTLTSLLSEEEKIRKEKTTIVSGNNNNNGSIGDDNTGGLYDQFKKGFLGESDDNDSGGLSDLKLPTKGNISNNGNKKLVEEYDGVLVPKYEIVYKRDFEMSEYTYTSPTSLNTTKPKEIVVRVFLPLLDSIKNVNLDVSENFMKLNCSESPKYSLDIHLPYGVMSDKVKAQFDKKSKTLKVSLCVIPDPIQKVKFDNIETTNDDEEQVLQEDKKVTQLSEQPNTEKEKIEDSKPQTKKKVTFNNEVETSSFVNNNVNTIVNSDTKIVLPQEINEGNRIGIIEKDKCTLQKDVPQQTQQKEFKNKYLLEID
ncbi:hypothetical protein ABK040_003975 [Willaertia magna]